MFDGNAHTQSPPTLDQTLQTETNPKFDTHKNAQIHKNNERLKALFGTKWFINWSSVNGHIVKQTLNREKVRSTD